MIVIGINSIPEADLDQLLLSYLSKRNEENKT